MFRFGRERGAHREASAARRTPRRRVMPALLAHLVAASVAPVYTTHDTHASARITFIQPRARSPQAAEPSGLPTCRAYPFSSTQYG